MSRRRTSLPIRWANVGGVLVALTIAALAIWAGGSAALHLLAYLDGIATGMR